MVGQNWAQGRVVLQADELRCLWAASSIWHRRLSFSRDEKHQSCFPIPSIQMPFSKGRGDIQIYMAYYLVGAGSTLGYESQTHARTKAQTWGCECMYTGEHTCAHTLTRSQKSMWCCLSLWVDDLSAKQNFFPRVLSFVSSPDQATNLSLCIEGGNIVEILRFTWQRLACLLWVFLLSVCQQWHLIEHWDHWTVK